MKDPVAMATRPGDQTLYVGQRVGRVWAIRGGELDTKPLLDISSQVMFGGDRGLFSLAFSPEGSQLYVSFTDTGGADRVVEFAFRADRIDSSSGRTVLRVPQPSIRHHGGDIAFGSDGFMWVGLGDGSLDNDALRTAQSLRTLLGKLLRIDPTSPNGRRTYLVPSDNPFVHQAHAEDEIFASGLRNPWRFSFDSETGDLWIGDVGQYRMEEIDFLRYGTGAGANFGWSLMEGGLSFRGSPPRDYVAPLAEYPHEGGRCAVIGGYVYRGHAIPNLNGAYLYADFCDARIRALVQREGRLAFQRDLGVRLQGVASFGEGPDGELYVLSLPNGVYRLDPAA
jgi:glucose/arabinose dehydrogenase